ncbi:class I SAM-dependent methyltransferase [Amycolatopsis carbonis]|uniref:Class I SAM-dependent methyltransferase n=1 Tax=Amycolatopsis carbonis TaxID=715471 RepID=A0A9Y2IMW1_9PSEU|nr:class I SAM-dependent methyltransferase [Amycolatopsis sp. 2-15]WIX83047.1 class I SAM-dependent methyltransferase [Amycolatopsis sp. 2-15]
MTFTRRDGDTWDLASSVGATATAAAAARAIATRTDPALIDDPFAEPLVRAVGIDLLTRLATGELPPDSLVGQEAIDGAKVRTKMFRHGCTHVAVMVDRSTDTRARVAFFEACGFASLIPSVPDDLLGAEITTVLERTAQGARRRGR